MSEKIKLFESYVTDRVWRETRNACDKTCTVCSDPIEKIALKSLESLIRAANVALQVYWHSIRVSVLYVGDTSLILFSDVSYRNKAEDDIGAFSLDRAIE
jgi:hypothetical protein